MLQKEKLAKFKEMEKKVLKYEDDYINHKEKIISFFDPEVSMPTWVWICYFIELIFSFLTFGHWLLEFGLFGLFATIISSLVSLLIFDQVVSFIIKFYLNKKLSFLEKRMNKHNKAFADLLLENGENLLEWGFFDRDNPEHIEALDKEVLEEEGLLVSESESFDYLNFLTLTDLKLLAKSERIPFISSNTKEELIEKITSFSTNETK